ncbi:DNA ligase 1 [Durio zibethinus]|uniref:DNA ligase 1 n=1 Tax=Durio zibethinus TaxID=66656 RepID=A0A6P6A0C5_DURZI|nr:DNA ligase 1 [Durio zibethinus]
MGHCFIKTAPFRCSNLPLVRAWALGGLKRSTSQFFTQLQNQEPESSSQGFLFFAETVQKSQSLFFFFFSIFSLEIKTEASDFSRILRMPSEDSKQVKKEEPEDDEADRKILSSMVENRKKKLSSNSNNADVSNSKSRPKEGKVKKEELVDDDDHGKDEDFKIPIKGSSSGSRAKATKLKREESDDEDEKPISKRSSDNKADKEKELKKKKKKGEEKKAAAGKEGKRGRKVYDLPGQKRDPPEERDPLRIFYETMYKQIPHSEMAQFWMMESGLLPIVEAKKVFEKKQKKIQQQKLSSPMKAASAVKGSTKSVPVKKTPPITPVSSNKKRTDSKVALNQTKKRKAEESSDDDFENVLASRTKKQRAN